MKSRFSSNGAIEQSKHRAHFQNGANRRVEILVEE